MTDEVQKGQPRWKQFEKLAYEIQKELAGSATVTLNDSIQGVDSKIARQIDISVRQNIGQYPILVVIDCKDYKGPVDIKAIEEFSGMVRDVRANKGAIISSNGFTEAALTLAKTHGLDTFRLLDTENLDWKSYVTIPVLLEKTFIAGFSFEVCSTGSGPFRLPYDTGDLMKLPLSYSDGADAKTALEILHSRWDKQEIPHEPGTHKVLLGKDVTIDFQGVKSVMEISAFVIVGLKYYLGPLPIRVRGLHDAQTGAIITRQITTEAIEPYLIERGKVPGWTEIDDPSKLSVHVMLQFGYSDLYTADSEEKGWHDP